MTTITLKINEKTKSGKAFLEMTNGLIKESKSIEIIENLSSKTKPDKKEVDKSYNEEFVAKVLNSFKNDKKTIIKTADIWQNI